MFEPIASGLSRFTTRRPWIAIIAVVGLVAVLGAQGRPSMSNDSAEFAPDDPAITAAERIDAAFGSDASVTPLQLVVLSDAGDVVTTDGLDAVRAVEAEIAATEIDGVRLADRLVEQPGTGAITSFMSPVELAITAGAPVPATDEQLKETLDAALARVPAERSQLLAELFEADVTSGSLVSPSGLIVTFVEAPADAAEAELLADLEGALATRLSETIAGDITVLPFSPELITFAGAESAIEIPLLLFGAIGIIGFALLLVYLPSAPMRRFRRIRRTAADTLLTLLVVIFAITATDGAAVLLGPDGLGVVGSVSGASSIVPILIVALGVDYVIHLNAAYRDGLAASSAADGAMRRSVRIVGGALVLSALTTSFGFLTNLFSGNPSLFTFGVLSTIGIVLAFLFASLLFPAGRLLLDRRAADAHELPAAAFARAEGGWVDRVVGATSVIPRRAPWAAVGLAAIVLVAAGLTATNLRSGFSFLDFVPQGSLVRDGATELAERFDGGLGETTQVLVDGDITEPEVWNTAVAATAAAGGIDGIVTLGGEARVTSPQGLVASLIDEAAPTFDPAVAAAVEAAGLDADLVAGPDADLAGVIEAVQTAAPERLAGVVADGAALYTFTTQAGTDGALELASALEVAFGPGSVATSQEIIGAAVIESVSRTQAQSLVLALIGAAILLMLSFRVSDRRPMLGILAVAPVGGVVVLLYAFMVLAGIEFGPVTATLAAVVIGIGVDYTIHVVHRFVDFRREGLTVDVAITRTLGTTGSALVASAVTTSLGFALLTQSSLIPFQQLGWLILAAVIGSALVSVLVLPSMLVIWARWSERRVGAPAPSRPADVAMEPRESAA